METRGLVDVVEDLALLGSALLIVGRMISSLVLSNMSCVHILVTLDSILGPTASLLYVQYSSRISLSCY